jgi:hypothetical protein
MLGDQSALQSSQNIHNGEGVFDSYNVAIAASVYAAVSAAVNHLLH